MEIGSEVSVVIYLLYIVSGEKILGKHVTGYKVMVFHYMCLRGTKLVLPSCTVHAISLNNLSESSEVSTDTSLTVLSSIQGQLLDPKWEFITEKPFNQ